MVAGNALDFKEYFGQVDVNAMRPGTDLAQTCDFVWSSAFRRPNAIAHPNRLKAELQTGDCLDAW
jgi:hypothetical protein